MKNKNTKTTPNKPWEIVKKQRKLKKQSNKNIKIACVVYPTLVAIGFAIMAYLGLISDIQGMVDSTFYEAQASYSDESTVLSVEERLWTDLDNYGFTLQEKIKTITMIGTCENPDWDIDARYINKPTTGCPRGSVDRGLFMINDCYHAEVSNACAYDYECALPEFIRIYRARGFGEWTCGKTLNLK